MNATKRCDAFVCFVYVGLFALNFELKLKVNRIFKIECIEKGVLFIVTVSLLLDFLVALLLFMMTQNIDLPKSLSHRKPLHRLKKRKNEFNSMQWKRCEIDTNIFPCHVRIGKKKIPNIFLNFSRTNFPIAIRFHFISFLNPPISDMIFLQHVKIHWLWSMRPDRVIIGKLVQFNWSNESND